MLSLPHKRVHVHCYFLVLFFSYNLSAQSLHLNVQDLETASSSERSDFIRGLKLEGLDSTAFLAIYYPLLDFAIEEKDDAMEWDLRFHYFLLRGELGTSAPENIELLIELKRKASEQGLKVRQLVANHYLVFEQYYFDQVSHGSLYVNILKEFEQMKEAGFEKFRDYPLVWMLYHNGRFMYELGDLDKALQFLNVAEQFIEPTEPDRQTYVLVLNHLQAIYQKQNDL